MTFLRQYQTELKEEKERLQLAKHVAKKHAIALAQSGHYPMAYAEPLFKAAMAIIEAGIQDEDTRLMTKAMAMYGIKYGVDTQSWINSICMKYHTQMNYR